MGIYSLNKRKRNTLIMTVMVLGIALLLSAPRIIRSISGTGGAANSLEVPVQSGNGDNDIDARFGSDKAACLFLTGTPVSADQITLRAGDTFLFGGHDSHGVPQSRIEWTSKGDRNRAEALSMGDGEGAP